MTYSQKERPEEPVEYPWVDGMPDEEGYWRLSRSGDVRSFMVVLVERTQSWAMCYRVLETDEVFSIRSPIGRWQRLTEAEAERYQ